MVEIHRAAKVGKSDGIRDFRDVRADVVEAENTLESCAGAGGDLDKVGEVLQRAVEHHEVARECHE